MAGRYYEIAENITWLLQKNSKLGIMRSGSLACTRVQKYLGLNASTMSMYSYRVIAPDVDEYRDDE